MRHPIDNEFAAALALSFLHSARKTKPQPIDPLKAEIAEWNRRIEARKAEKRARRTTPLKA